MLTEPEKEAVMFLVRRRVDTILRHPHHREHTFTMLTVGDEQGLEERVLPLVQRVFDSQTHKFGRRWRICRVEEGERKRGKPTPLNTPPPWGRQTVYNGDAGWMLERWPCKVDLVMGMRAHGHSPNQLRQGGLLCFTDEFGARLVDRGAYKAHIDKPNLWLAQLL